MFPMMNKEGLYGALAHRVLDHVNEGIALGYYTKSGLSSPARMGEGKKGAK